MDKIKIAEVITRLDRGGAPDIVRIIISRLNSLDYEIKLVSGQSKDLSSKTNQMLNGLGKERAVTIAQLQREINPLLDAISLFKLYSLFKKEKFDIVHTHTAKAGALGRIAAKLAGVPVVIHTPHGHNFYGYFGPLMSKAVVIIEKILSHFSDKILVLTVLEKNDLIKFKIIPSEKIAVINTGVELGIYRNIKVDIDRKKEELGIERGVKLVGMVGRLERIKGPQYFIQAAKIISDKIPGVKFLIVGDGALKSKLEDEGKKLNIFDKCIFTGWREDIGEILSILDILVLPSLNEAVGRILIESALCGIPVVAANVGGVPEIVLDKETGILVPPQDEHSLAEAIISLLEDEEKRVKMGKAAKEAIGGKFEASKMVENISSLYTELTKNEKA